VNIGASAVYSPYWDTQFRFSDFGASIRKVKVTSFYISEKDLTHKVEENIFGEKKFSPSLTYPTICEWASVGECGTNLELNKDEKISLKIRIGKEIGGWIDGRLGNPAVATKSINSSQYEFKIEANPVSVPNYEGKIAIDQLPNQIVENNPINLMPGGMGVLANSPNF
jgi:hypothetical protein